MPQPRAGIKVRRKGFLNFTVAVQAVLAGVQSRKGGIALRRFGDLTVDIPLLNAFNRRIRGHIRGHVLGHARSSEQYGKNQEFNGIPDWELLSPRILAPLMRPTIPSPALSVRATAPSAH